MVKVSAVLLLIISLAACNRGVQSNDAVRQGVIDHLAASQAKTGLNLGGMDVAVKSVQYTGNDVADAVVSITPKGGNPDAGMSINYHLTQQSGKWVVVGRQDAHGAVAAPDGANPHGAGAIPNAPVPGGSKMPSPDDLPPAGKK